MEQWVRLIEIRTEVHRFISSRLRTAVFDLLRDAPPDQRRLKTLVSSSWLDRTLLPVQWRLVVFELLRLGEIGRVCNLHNRP